MQGTTLAFYPTEVCGFWGMEPKANCRFCATGLNVSDSALPTVDEVVEVCKAAREEGASRSATSTPASSRARSWISSGLSSRRSSPARSSSSASSARRTRTSPSTTGHRRRRRPLLVLLRIPEPRLVRQGLSRESRSTSARRRSSTRMEYTTRKMGKGRNSGEIIAGIEPLEDTFKAIDYITGIGAFPTICVFRPVIGTDMANAPSPRYEDMVAVYRRMYYACRRQLHPDRHRAEHQDEPRRPAVRGQVLQRRVHGGGLCL